MNRSGVRSSWGIALLLAIPLAGGLTVTADSASGTLDRIGVDRGLVVILGPGAGELALKVVAESELTVFVQTPAHGEANRWRRAADDAGLLGSRIYVSESGYRRIGLADNLADGALVTGGSVPLDELKRVVRPGAAIVTKEGVVRKRPVVGTDVWSHPYHGPDNNPQSTDQVARGPFRTKFLATPWYGPMPQVTVAADGRLYKAFGHIAFKKREWPLVNKLVCMSAYNGTVLWEYKLTEGFMIHRNTMVALDGLLYIADNESCKVLDGATGAVKHEIKVADIAPDAKDQPGWKWMAIRDGVLYALVGKPDPLDETLKGGRTQSGWPWSGMGRMYARGPKDHSWGFGHTVVAVDLKNKKLLWSLYEKEPLDSRAFCMNRGQLFIYSHQKFLAAINTDTGSLMWRSSDSELMAAIGEHDRAQTWKKGYSTSAYAKCDDKAIFFAGPQRSKLAAVSAESGKLMWTHDDGNVQLVLREDALYAMARENMAKKFDLYTGKLLDEFECHRGNCTRATGTVESIFARGQRHGGTVQLGVADDKPRRIPAMRPACQDGVLVAHGQLYWGPWMCDCNHSLVGIISLEPAGSHTDQDDSTDRHVTRPDAASKANAFPVDQRDWPTYRQNNRRTSITPVRTPQKHRLLWQTSARVGSDPTAPVVANGTVFIGGQDGAVRAIDAATGESLWNAYTGGPIRYPPAVTDNRVFVGSGDGQVYSLDPRSGSEIWRFRAAPIDRRIPVYGRLSSTWPVHTGVLVGNGVLYAGAGIVSHDGTHVYALDARTGRVKWHNNTSGKLLSDDVVTGVSVQGHLLMNDGKLYMAGGNVVSPAIYDAKTGECRNTLQDMWQKAPRGSELFLMPDSSVSVTDQLMHSPRRYIPSRYHKNYLVQAGEGDAILRCNRAATTHFARSADDGKHGVKWQHQFMVETQGAVLSANAALVVGTTPDKTDPNGVPLPALLSFDRESGAVMWAQQLPALCTPWGIAVDRDGRVILTLVDGRVMAFGSE